MTQLKNEAFHKPLHVWSRVSMCWIQNYCEMCVGSKLNSFSHHFYTIFFFYYFYFKSSLNHFLYSRGQKYKIAK